MNMKLPTSRFGFSISIEPMENRLMRTALSQLTIGIFVFQAENLYFSLLPSETKFYLKPSTRVANKEFRTDFSTKSPHSARVANTCTSIVIEICAVALDS